MLLKYNALLFVCTDVCIHTFMLESHRCRAGRMDAWSEWGCYECGAEKNESNRVSSVRRASLSNDSRQTRQTLAPPSPSSPSLSLVKMDMQPDNHAPSLCVFFFEHACMQAAVEACELQITFMYPFSRYTCQTRARPPKIVAL